jgi:hypothetical protein
MQGLRPCLLQAYTLTLHSGDVHWALAHQLQQAWGSYWGPIDRGFVAS